MLYCTLAVLYWTNVLYTGSVVDNTSHKVKTQKLSIILQFVFLLTPVLTEKHYEYYILEESISNQTRPRRYL